MLKFQAVAEKKAKKL